MTNGIWEIINRAVKPVEFDKKRGKYSKTISIGFRAELNELIAELKNTANIKTIPTSIYRP